MSIKIDENLVNRILDLLSAGLTKGKGIPEKGEMCVEAVICYAQGLPHSDNPSCVGSSVRSMKIRLNDNIWSSNKARAEGMKKIAIAQLGSDKLDQEKFDELYSCNYGRIVLPYLIKKHYKDTKNVELLYWIERFKIVTKDNFDYLWSAFHKKFLKNSYYNSYNYYYGCCSNDSLCITNLHGDKVLLLIADAILQTLIEMKCEGCNYLYLIEQYDRPRNNH